MQKPVIPVTLAYCAGLLLGHGFLYFPFTIILLLITSVIIAVALISINKLAQSLFLLTAIPGLLGMCLYVFSATWLPADHYSRVAPADSGPHEITGAIASPLDRNPDRTGFTLQVTRINGSPVSGRIRVSIREQATTIGYGDTLRFTGKLYAPHGFQNPDSFDYAAHLARAGIYSTVSIKSERSIAVLSRGTGAFRAIQDWRERIRQAMLRSTSGQGSAILQAMVIGEEGQLDDSMRERFMAAGVTHIISISGSHLGMMALLCFGLLRGIFFLVPERLYHRLTLLTDPRKIAAWCTLPLVVFYTALAGGQVATVRSLIMIFVGLAAVLLDREHALLHALALAALIILVHSPQALFDISFQLSFLSVLVIGAVVLLWNDLQLKTETRAQKFVSGLVLMTIISIATSLATGPLVARYFNQFSYAALFSNLIVVPFAGLVVVPLGFFSGVASLRLDHLPMAPLNQFVSDMFIETVSFFSRLPFAESHPPAPGLLWLVLYMIFLLACAALIQPWLLWKYKPFEASSRIARGPAIVMMTTGVMLLLLMVPPLMPGKHTLVSFPDVNQGDSALIELAGGKTVLIDGGGTRDNRFDIGRQVLAPFLWNKGIRTLDLIILSHPHPDHLSGLIAILRNFKVTEVWTSGLDADLPGYGELMDIINRHKILHKAVSADDPLLLFGSAEIRVLHPKTEYTSKARKPYAAENDRSLVVQITSQDKVFLFTGDIGRDGEDAVLKALPDNGVDVVKVAHHGSKSSSSDAFVARIHPRIAVVTVGKGNFYRHPSDEVVARFEQTGSRIYRTDRDGLVMIKVTGTGLTCRTWSELKLRRATDAEWSGWLPQEVQNWKRVRLRIWET